ncbi:MAG: hypothetical protein ABW122_14050 [Ilumatobacteraceae bacterium]
MIGDRVVVVAVHEVPDYERWKRAFDRGMELIVSPGMLAHRLYHATDAADEVLVAFDFDTLENAEAFLASADQAWLDNAGLDVYPPVFVGRPVEIVDHTPPDAVG